MRWKDFLYFRRGSKTAVILLMILIVLTLILNILLSYRDSSAIVVVQNDSIARAFDEFLKNLKANPPASIPPTGRGLDHRLSREAGASNGGGQHVPDKGLFFDTDAGSSHAETDSEYPFALSEQDNASRANHRSSGYLPYPRTEKLAAGETISLNSPDTAEWKKIPGIGSAYASRIVEYRERLGGFVRKEQLMEVYRLDNEMYARVAPYVEPGGSWRKVAVNKLEFKELLRHPYLNYKQVGAIMNLRRRKGNITSIQELAMLDEFTPEDIARLEPYLEF